MTTTELNQLVIALGGIAFTYGVFRVHRWIKANIAYRRRVSRSLRKSPIYQDGR